MYLSFFFMNAASWHHGFCVIFMPLFISKTIRLLAWLGLMALLPSLLVACSSPRLVDARQAVSDARDAVVKAGQSVKPYKPEVVQGNFVSREQVAALRPGMPRAQVRNILGTPMLTDVFHPNRWDYVFTIEQSGVLTKTYTLTVYFNNDIFDHWEGDELPTETEFIGSIRSGRAAGKTPALAATEKDLIEFSKRENAREKSPLPESSPPAPAAKTYPPLESQ